MKEIIAVPPVEMTGLRSAIPPPITADPIALPEGIDNPNIVNLLEAFKENSTIANMESFDFSAPNDDPSLINDSVFIEPYENSHLILFDKQRRGIFESLPSDSPALRHVSLAINRASPFANTTKLPLDVSISLGVMFNTPTEDLLAFWKTRWSDIQELAKFLNPISTEWYSNTPHEIASATGTIHIALLDALMDNYGMGGREWLSQFIFGFPFIGFLSQSGVFSPSEKELESPPKPDLIFEEAENRFRSRASQQPPKEAERVWAEAIEQRDCGWLDGPFDLTDSGRIANDPLSPVNIAFRFPVIQPGKVRACDDCRHSTLNDFCVVATPISLPSWDHVAECVRRVSHTNSDIHFAVADQWAAYKCEPLRPDHIPLCILAIWNPSAMKFVGFKPITQLFGSTAAVLNYNVLSRIIASLANRIFAIPVIGYFDDFGFIVSANVCEVALRLFESFCELLGLHLKIEKSKFGNKITFLGVNGEFPSSLNDNIFKLSLPADKVDKWCSIINTMLASKYASHSDLGKINWQTKLCAIASILSIREMYASTAIQKTFL